jgi:hypothetical protein
VSSEHRILLTFTMINAGAEGVSIDNWRTLQRFAL